MSEPQFGEKLRFVPAAFTEFKEGGSTLSLNLPREVTGRIVYINHAHRFYEVAFEVNDVPMREAFKF